MLPSLIPVLAFVRHGSVSAMRDTNDRLVILQTAVRIRGIPAAKIRGTTHTKTPEAAARPDGVVLRGEHVAGLDEDEARGVAVAGEQGDARPRRR